MLYTCHELVLNRSSLSNQYPSNPRVFRLVLVYSMVILMSQVYHSSLLGFGLLYFCPLLLQNSGSTRQSYTCIGLLYCLENAFYGMRYLKRCSVQGPTPNSFTIYSCAEKFNKQPSKPPRTKSRSKYAMYSCVCTCNICLLNSFH